MPEVLARYGMNMKPQEVPNRVKCSNFKLRRKGTLKGYGQKQLGNSMIANGAGLKSSQSKYFRQTQCQWARTEWQYM